MLRFVLAAVVAASAASCASPGEIRQAAMNHEQRARMFEARGDTAAAARERAAARKQWRKAARREAAWRRSYSWGYGYPYYYPVPYYY